MEVFGVSAAANQVQSNSKVQSAQSSSDANFLASFSQVAGSSHQADVPQVFAGDSKEFEFWLKDEKVASKPFKYRTKDDALAEIEGIVEALVKEQAED